MLERLSPEVEAIIAEHNTEALNSLLSYVSGYITANIAVLPPDNVLPLSGLSYPMPHVQTLSPSDPVQQGVVSGALLEHHKEVVIVSPFVALSGRYPGISEPVVFATSSLCLVCACCQAYTLQICNLRTH